MRLRRRQQWAWGLVGIGMLGWVAAGLDWSQVWAALRGLRPGQLLALAGLNAAVLLPLYARWWVILRGMDVHLPLRTVARYALAGYAVSYFTPGPHTGGEPVQVRLVQRHGVPAATATAAVVVDKALTMLGSFLFLGGGIWVVVQTQLLEAAVARQALWAGGMAAVLPAGLLAGWMGNRRPVGALVSAVGIEQRRPAVSDWIFAAEEQIVRLCTHRPRVMLEAVGLTAVSWLFLMAEYAAGVSFLGLHLTGTQLIGALTAVRLAHLLPMPGALGVLEAGQVAALTLLGVEAAAVGLSISLLIRLRDVLLGGIGLWFTRDLFSAVEERP